MEGGEQREEREMFGCTTMDGAFLKLVMMPFVE